MEHDKSLRPKVGLGVLIFKEGKVLLGKRKHADGLGDGEYAGTGGHLEYMESIEACAKRETLEECGLEIENVRFFVFGKCKRICAKALCRYWING
jgi:ADP-ribose pyrophosphatase YjhB (NUDIX family)